MSKLNKKGFMLAEVVIVSVVVAVTLVSLFVGLNRVTKAYEKRNNYYDIDAEYLCIEANNTLTSKPSFDGKINIGWLSNYKTIFGFENVSVYYSNCKLNSINNLNVTNQTFKDYISYLSNNLDCTGYSYVIISEICRTKDDCGYYTLKAKEE